MQPLRCPPYGALLFRRQQARLQAHAKAHRFRVERRDAAAPWPASGPAATAEPCFVLALEARHRRRHLNAAIAAQP